MLSASASQENLEARLSLAGDPGWPSSASPLHDFTKTKGPVCLSGRAPTTWLQIFLDATTNSRCFKGGAWGFPGSRPGLEAANILPKINDAKGQRSGCRSLHFPMGHPHSFLFPTVPPGIARKCTRPSFWISSFSSHPVLRLPSQHLRRCALFYSKAEIPGLLPVCLSLSASTLCLPIFFFLNLAIIRGFLKRGKIVVAEEGQESLEDEGEGWGWAEGGVRGE